MERGHARTPAPSLNLTYRKHAEKEPFRAWDEVEAIVAAGELDAGQEAALWESVYLDEGRLRSVLECVRGHARDPFLHPMVAFAIYIGARRSEVVASRRGDVDLGRGVVLIRERKRKQAGAGSFHHVPIHPDLAAILKAWLGAHPGGPYRFCRLPGEPLSWNSARKYLRRALDGGPWANLGGWHAFRHSFATNCARNGVPQSHIDAWLGHQTEAMRDRYRHHFPQDLRGSIGLLFARP